MPSIIPDIANIPWFNVIGTIAKYLGIIVFMAASIGAAWFMTYLGNFKFKGIEFPLYASGDKDNFSVGKSKRQRFKWKDKAKTTWQPLYPLFNKTELEPFSEEYIYPGNQVYCFKFGDRYIPGKVNVLKNEKGEFETKINPVPHFVRKWESIMYKQYANELQKQGFWEENKYFIMGVITVAICCATALATIYISYQMVGANKADLQALTQVIRGVGNIPGR